MNAPLSTETDLTTRLYEYTEHYRPNKLMIDAAREIERLRGLIHEMYPTWNEVDSDLTERVRAEVERG